jgi:uncharacterized protein (DUF1015 family)
VVDAAPFRALRYDPAVAGDPATTSAPAYDELERFVYARHRTASPYTVLELLTRTGVPPSYRWAGAALRRWERTGVLVTDAKPAYYLYEEHELRSGVPAVQRGVLAAVAVGDRRVHAHERVDAARVADRVARLSEVPVDLAPVFAVYRGAPDTLRRVLRRPPNRPPLLAMTDEAGLDHRVWRLDAPVEVEQIRDGLADVQAVIADGHHRYAAAVAMDGSSSRTLMYLVDAEEHGPQILAVHRLLHGVGDSAFSDLAPEVEATPAPADITTLATMLDRQDGRAWAVRLPGNRALLLSVRDEAALQARLPGGRSAAWRALDTAVLQHAVLPRLRPESIEYRTDPVAAAAEVEQRQTGALLLLRPVDVAAVYACAAAGDPMPPKTTWFRPKPRAGLVMRSLDSR